MYLFGTNGADFECRRAFFGEMSVEGITFEAYSDVLNFLEGYLIWGNAYAKKYGNLD